MSAHALYICRTTHTRFAPFKRQFGQRLAFLFLDIDALDVLPTRLLRCNRRGLVSFQTRDHGDRSGGPLRAWVEQKLAGAGVALDGGAVKLLTLPRVFGYVFNPLSVFFGYGPAGDLRGVVYEVNNTFGQTHAYAAHVPPQNGAAHHAAPKAFHVSPFMAVRGDYAFTLGAPGETLGLTVDNIVDGERLHSATLRGKRTELTDAALLKMMVGLPLMTLQVIAGIHWHALWLWLRGARYHPVPPAPASSVTKARAL